MSFLVLVPSELEAKYLKDLSLDLHLIGIGPIDSALSAYEIFREKRPSLAFLTGFAGAYPKSELEIGDVVVGTCEKFVDFGRKYETHLTPLPENIPAWDYCPLTHVFTEKLIYILEVNGFNPQGGPLATVCAATYDLQRARFIEEKFQVLAENMEGFGVGRAARRTKVFLLEIRVISNILSAPEKDWDFERAGKRLREVWECLLREWK
ncbi:hypothetical protein THC_1277 [Caldimicrobium thiodismutans]|jgi:futalosine hydrolase|uniref:Nucleoside phosphorylase domain-containing protein n=1 Tax=Caldimicrobium thiodismutans TaxID=1653476 RepID=A0A0U4W3H9_9BACT|nr:hypothetical protein [Caldimicrobium thiodismutans]BAU23645.1 hypothetical protein THC_1277 [Caldimicrobium thiodismutans]